MTFSITGYLRDQYSPELFDVSDGIDGGGFPVDTQDETDLTTTQETLEELEDWAVKIEHGIERYTIPPGLEPALEALGVFTNTSRPALEAYANNVTYLQAALEAVRDQQEEAETFQKKLRHRLSKGLIGDAKVLKRKKQVKGMKSKATQGLETLEGVNWEGQVEVELKGLAKKVAVNGTVPDNLIKAFQGDYKATAFLLGDYFDQVLKYNEKAQETVSLALAADRGKAKEKIKAFLNETPPLGLIPEDVREGKVLLGNLKVNQPKPKDIKEDDLRGQIKEITRQKMVPNFTHGKGAEGSTTVKVSKRDAQVLLNLIKDYAEVLEKANQQLTRRAGNLMFEAKDFRQRQADTKTRTKTTDMWSTEVLLGLVKKSPLAVTKVLPGMIGHLLSSAEAALEIVQKATKAAQKAK